GETAADSIGAILHRDPEWSRLPADTPPTIQLLLRRCLARDRQRRLQSMADARVEIEDALEDPTGSSLNLAQAVVDEADRRAMRRRLRPLLLTTLAFTLGAAAVLSAAWWLWPKAEARPVRRFEFAEHLEPSEAVISPDGEAVAIVAQNRLYIHQLDTATERLIWEHPGDRRIERLFWSPDSRSLGFFTGWTLYRISRSGGEPTLIKDNARGWKPSWGEDDRIVMCGFAAAGISLISARNGKTVELPKDDDTLHFHSTCVLPGGRGMLTVPHLHDGAEQSIWLYSMEGEPLKELYEHSERLYVPGYSPSGHLLFTQHTGAAGVYAVPFSLERLEATGEPQLIAPGASDYSESNCGDLVFWKAQASGDQRQLTWRSLTGENLGTVGPVLKQAFDLTISPDGRQAVVGSLGPDYGTDSDDPDPWIIDLERGTMLRLVAEEGFQAGFTWSPDSTRLIYTSFQRDLVSPDLFIRNADGSGDAELMVKGAAAASMTPDWSQMLFMSGDFMDGFHLASQRLGDPGSRRDYERSDQWQIFPLVNPGHDLLAYAEGSIFSDLTLMIRPWPEGHGRWQVSPSGTNYFVWSRTGDRLYFSQEQADSTTICEVTVTMEQGRPLIGEPHELFQVPGINVSFDLSPDGTRLLLSEGLGLTEEKDRGVVLIQNWPAMLR
ncbi:MAG: PD40 domain-containing protein, partial [Phycisphaerales bacterium]|nr:PD40 domain-containing protein [Phycisphaerales bacterium]